MYLLKSLRTTSAPPSTLGIRHLVARGKTLLQPSLSTETENGKSSAGKTAKHKTGATGREIYVFLAGRGGTARFHIPQFFFAVSAKYLMIVFIFYRTPALSCVL